MKIQRECKHHGMTDFRIESQRTGKYRCVRCESEKVQKRRTKLKQIAIDYMGGKCGHCGYGKCSAALEFHHKDPTQKDFGIAYKGRTMSEEKMKAELDKCVMLCANCHREEHVRLRLE